MRVDIGYPASVRGNRDGGDIPVLPGLDRVTCADLPGGATPGIGGVGDSQPPVAPFRALLLSRRPGSRGLDRAVRRPTVPDGDVVQKADLRSGVQRDLPDLAEIAAAGQAEAHPHCAALLVQAGRLHAEGRVFAPRCGAVQQAPRGPFFQVSQVEAEGGSGLVVLPGLLDPDHLPPPHR